MIKKIIAAILILLLFNTNLVCAENWVTITAENGKSVDLDIDSINLVLDTVEYNIRTISDNYTYIIKQSTELYKKGVPTAVIYSGQYKDGTLISEEKVINRNYRTLKSGTLQSEVFDVLSKELDKKSFKQGSKTWNKYLKKQRKKIQKKWTPSTNKWNGIDKTEKATLLINKDGSIQRNAQTSNYWLRYLNNIDALPEEYTGEVFKLDVKMNYYKYAGAKVQTPKPLVRQISPTHSEVTVAKNQRPPVIGHIQFSFLWLYEKALDFLENGGSFLPETGNILIDLIEIPILIVGALAGFTALVAFAVLFCVSGGDMGDV